MPPKEVETPTTTAAEHYKARLAAYVKDKDPIAMQREAPGTLARLIEGVTAERLKQSPASGKWRQILRSSKAI